MACRQPILAGFATAGSTLTRYFGVEGAPYDFMNAATDATTTVHWSCTYLNFSFVHATDPGTSKSFTYTLVKNGVDTSIVITVNSSNFAFVRNTSSVSVVSGDQLYWRRDTTGTPTLSRVQYACEVNQSTAFFNGYTGVAATNTTTTWRCPLFYPSNPSTAVASSRNTVLTLSGTLTRLDYISTGGSPGTAKSYEFALEINGTKQDGTGGTTDTRVTISGAATSGAWTGSIAFVAGNYYTILITPSGTPTAVTYSVAVSVTTTTDGESQIGYAPQFNLPTTGTSYYLATGELGTGTVNSSTETDVALRSTLHAFDLKQFRVRLNGNVGTGPITFNTRRTASTPAGTPTVTLTTGQSAASDASDVVTIADGDTLDVQYVATGSPGIGFVASYAWVAYSLASPSPITGSVALGYKANVTIDKAGMIALDGTAHTNNTTGTFEMWALVKTKPGNGTTLGGVPCGIAPDISSNTSGTTQNTFYDLNALAIPANALSADKKWFAFTFFGTTAGNANAKDFRLSWGTHTFTLVVGNTGNAKPFVVCGQIIRTGVGAQMVMATIAVDTVVVGVVVSAGVEDETTALTLKLQSQNTAAAAASATGKGATAQFQN